MKLITERSLIQGVATKWRAQYRGEKVGILQKLTALDKDRATSEDVARIIGNKSWTWLICDECGNSVDAVIELGQEPDYESATARICFACLKEAGELAKL